VPLPGTGDFDFKGAAMHKISAAEQAELIATAHALADAARLATLQHFRQPDLTADTKEAARFDPVTVADRLSEERMRAILAERRPQDGILGEEYGATSGTSGLTWVLDPIDGTRGFMAGTPTWGVLIALCDETGPRFGMIAQPYTGERFSGGFGTTEFTGPQGGGGGRLRVRDRALLSQAVLLSTFPEVGTEAEGAAFRRVAREVQLVRYGLDCYGYALLAAGQVDLVIEAGLQSYDIAAPLAVIEAAGGIVTDWQGGPAHEGGQVIACGSARLHEQALERLNATA
jgi:histidinol phosphatase-like enzyme (inositol monophosphatase family)